MLVAGWCGRPGLRGADFSVVGFFFVFIPFPGFRRCETTGRDGELARWRGGRGFLGFVCELDGLAASEFGGWEWVGGVLEERLDRTFVRLIDGRFG
jgi:hypothetical protein